jgi:membrane-bound lytic murein transglycosylase D
MLKHLFVFVCLFVGLAVSGQGTTRMSPTEDPLKKDAFINTVEQSLQLFLADYVNQSNYDSLRKLVQFETGETPQFSDAIYCERLQKLNEMTPFQLDCNSASLSTIRFFAQNRRGFAKVVLGRSKLYFDLFEEKLAEYGLPIELKYLAVIESGLRPQVKSRAGALGLWQFMYRTGLYFGLTENSYIDERMDPVLATDAACRYLKQLYGIYGDWNLALAAYNAGPGNVNKAIRRSGNKKTYWEVRPFLPAETQGYVPNFIAATYLLTYYVEHNIQPLPAKIHYAQLDTICLNNGVHMSTISKLIDWNVEDIQQLNPIYKTTFIPKNRVGQCLTGPLEKIGLLVSLEDSLYALERFIHVSRTPITLATDSPVTLPQPADSVPSIAGMDSLGVITYHKVRKGETMASIATKYGVSVEKILEWNALRTSNIYVGQRIKLFGVSSSTTATPVPVKPTQPKKFYEVKTGDTFSKIAQKYGMTQTQLAKLNPRININRLTIGQRLRVK